MGRHILRINKNLYRIKILLIFEISANQLPTNPPYALCIILRSSRILLLPLVFYFSQFLCSSDGLSPFRDLPFSSPFVWSVFALAWPFGGSTAVDCLVCDLWLSATHHHFLVASFIQDSSGSEQSGPRRRQKRGSSSR